MILRKFVKDPNPLKDLFNVHCDKRNFRDVTKRRQCHHIRDPGDKSSVKTELIKWLESELRL